MKTIVVIPNHLPHLDFLQEWTPYLADKEIIIMQDIGDKPEIPKGYTNVTVYDHSDVKKDLGKNEWIIPTQSSACRSYGYYKAWQRGADAIMTLDNDCFHDGSDFFQGHLDNLSAKVTLDWVPNTSDLDFTRGFPYEIRNCSPVAISHGLWSSVPDLDGMDMIRMPGLRLEPSTESLVIPRNSFYAMCGMNLAWDAQFTPAMYFGIFGPKYGFDQYDDIWAGVLSKKIVDYFRYGVISGYPSVEHRKQSNRYVNLKKQLPGLEMNEHFWAAVQDIQLTANGITGAYRELIEKLPDTFTGEPEGYTKKFKEAALLWANLFE